MGQSTDGILVFGFDCGEDDPLLAKVGEDAEPEDDEGEGGDDPDIEDLIAADAGLKEPAHQDYKSKDWSKYWDAKRAAVEASPVDIVRYCSGDYPMFIVAVRGTEKCANRGDTIEIDPAALVIEPAKIEAAKAFCAKHGIEWQEPSWLLCSMWN